MQFTLLAALTALAVGPACVFATPAEPTPVAPSFPAYTFTPPESIPTSDAAAISSWYQSEEAAISSLNAAETSAILSYISSESAALNSVAASVSNSVVGTPSATGTSPVSGSGASSTAASASASATHSSGARGSRDLQSGVVAAGVIVGAIAALV